MLTNDTVADVDKYSIWTNSMRIALIGATIIQKVLDFDEVKIIDISSVDEMHTHNVFIINNYYHHGNNKNNTC